MELLLTCEQPVARCSLFKYQCWSFYTHVNYLLPGAVCSNNSAGAVLTYKLPVARCSLSKNQVLELYQRGSHAEADESTSIMLLPTTTVVNMQSQDPALWAQVAPSAKGCILLYKLCHGLWPVGVVREYSSYSTQLCDGGLYSVYSADIVCVQQIGLLSVYWKLCSQYTFLTHGWVNYPCIQKTFFTLNWALAKHYYTLIIVRWPCEIDRILKSITD